VLESKAQGSHSPDFPYNPRWSPDGRSLVLTINRVDDAQANITGAAIVVIDAHGAASQAPRVLTDWEMFAAYPDWHRSGDLIVFTTYDLGNFQTTTAASNLYTIRPDGSALTQLTSHGPGETRATQPTWTPDGDRIIFTQVGKEVINGYDTPRQPAFIDPDGTGEHVLAGIGATHPRLRPTP
jgi:Tol biopolymer transport system component